MTNSFKILVVSLMLGNLPSIGQQNIATASSYFENGEFSISWGIGELAIATFNSNDYILTQGFQQSKLKVVNIENTDTQLDAIKVYPNPTNDFVYLNFKNNIPSSAEYQIMDSEGKVIDKQDIAKQPVRVSFVNLKPGMYFMQVFSNNKPMKTFKIVKK